MSIIAATAFALQGYDQAVANGLLTLPTFLSTFPQTKNPNIQGTVIVTRFVAWDTNGFPG